MALTTALTIALTIAAATGPSRLQAAGSPAVHRTAGAAATVVDDSGRAIALAAPARRVVALAPALVELSFEAGGGAALVGVVEHSDAPPAARALPRVGDALALDAERLLALQPDLILAWESGSSPRLLARLEGLGVPVFRSRIERMDDIATTLDRLAVLFGLPPPPAAAAVRMRLARLDEAMAEPARRAPPPVRVFYQVWAQPLMTIGRNHAIDDLIGRCGGANLFRDAPARVPQVAIEAVVAAAPELIITSSTRAGGDESLVAWARFPTMPAVKNGALLYVDADAISRPTPRMLDAAEAICAATARARAAR